MESKNVLSATSLFCNQKNWPVLLRAIENFNKTVYKKSSFCLEFNYLSGENIRFSFLVQEKTADQLLKHTDEYFKSFFPSLKPVIKKQKGEIFKSFDENSIYYGLYAPTVIKKGEQKNYQLQFTLSKLIIAALKEEDHLDDETILTLACYFTITVIKLAINNFSVQKKVLIKYFKDLYKQSGCFEAEIIKAKFRENKPILLEIYASIGDKEAPGWIKKWEHFVLQSFDKNSSEIESKTYFIFRQIKTQLGLSSTMQSMLSYFIFQALAKI